MGGRQEKLNPRWSTSNTSHTSASCILNLSLSISFIPPKNKWEWLGGSMSPIKLNCGESYAEFHRATLAHPGTIKNSGWKQNARALFLRKTLPSGIFNSQSSSPGRIRVPIPPSPLTQEMWREGLWKGR
jgi:hypothetical protein